jgi:hypothetical protein
MERQGGLNQTAGELNGTAGRLNQTAGELNRMTGELSRKAQPSSAYPSRVDGQSAWGGISIPALSGRSYLSVGTFCFYKTRQFFSGFF